MAELIPEGHRRNALGHLVPESLIKPIDKLRDDLVHQLVQLARTEAQAIIDADPQCEHPQNSLLWNRLRELKKTHINWAAIS